MILKLNAMSFGTGGLSCPALERFVHFPQRSYLLYIL